MEQPENTLLPLSLLFLLTLITGGHTEPITLRNETHVICVTSDTEPPIFLAPPVKDDADSANVVQLNLIPENEWKLNTSQNLRDGPMRDKQWEDLKINAIDFLQLHLDSSELLYSLSIYSVVDTLEFYLDDGEYMEMVFIKPESDNYWNNYTVELNNSEMTLYQNHKWLKHVTNFVPSNFVIKNSDDSTIYYKVFNYTYYYSDTISSEPTKISVEDCVVLYISTCSNCYLNVKNVDITNNQEYNIGGSETWAKVVLNHTNSEYQIYKGTYNKSSDGNWKIQATQCLKTEKNNEIKVFVNTNHNQTCLTLKDKKNNTNNQDNHVREEDFKDLQSQYERACESISGGENKDCQGYEICVKQTCTCPSGYKGLFCKQGCGPSEWGENCSKNCTCNNCDSFTGMCITTTNSTESEKYSKSSETAKIPVPNWVAILLIVIIIVVLFVGISTCRRSKSPDTVNSDVESHEQDSEGTNFLP